MKKSKFVVTGGAGFIGSHIANKLIEMGQNVLVIDNLSVGNKNHLAKKVQFLRQDINSKKIQNTIRKYKQNYIYHLAAYTNLEQSLKDPKNHLVTNFLSLVDLLEVAKDVKTKKFIFSSSAAVYGKQKGKLAKETDKTDPTSPYGVSKLAAEKYIEYYSKKYKLPHVCLRYSNVYGQKQSGSAEGGVVAIFISNALKGKSLVIYGQGRQSRDFIYVDDVVDANIAAINSISGTFNISTGRGVSIKKLHDLVAVTLGLKKSPVYKTKNFIGEKKSILDNSAFKTKTNWTPKTDIKSGIEKTTEYFKKI